ncbi:MAG: hypothetical protein AABX29_03010 [Nanoarchaeota archaeon]
MEPGSGETSIKPKKPDITFNKNQIDEFSRAIELLGGQIIVGNEKRDPDSCVIDTAARLGACLYEKVMFGNQDTKEDLEKMRKEGEAYTLHDIVSGKAIRKVRPILLDTIMKSISVSLSKGKISGPLTPTGLIALSVLARSPSDPQIRETVRDNAIQLLFSDIVAKFLYQQDKDFFNGQFEGSSLPPIIDTIFSPTPTAPGI